MALYFDLQSKLGNVDSNTLYKLDKGCRTSPIPSSHRTEIHSDLRVIVSAISGGCFSIYVFWKVGIGVDVRAFGRITVTLPGRLWSLLGDE